MNIKIKNFLYKVKDRLIYQILVFMFLMSLLTIAYLFIGNWVKQDVAKRYYIIQDDYSWTYQIDKIEEKNGVLSISGWAFELGKNAESGDYRLIFYDEKSKTDFFPELSYVERKDVNDYFLCEYDYTNCGFVGSIITDNLGLNKHVYEILLQPQGSQNVYATGVYYANGEMMFVKPEEYVPLEVINTDLEKIVNDGVLRSYRPDCGIYVFQYEGYLYWIAESYYGFINNDSRIQFQLDTTQVESLPLENLESGLTVSKLNFTFSRNELQELNLGKYRVAKAALPREYSVTKIMTGNYIKGWIWSDKFRPWYEFD